MENLKKKSVLDAAIIVPPAGGCCVNVPKAV